MKRIIHFTKDAPVKDGIALELYFKEISKFNPLTNEEELDLFTRYNNGDNVAKEKIIKANLKFVVTVAKAYQRTVSGIKLSDLIALGNEGLIKAVDRFDVSLKFRFISFAVWWIRQGIVENLRNFNTVINYPQNFYLSNNKIKIWVDDFYKHNQREPSYNEVCGYIEEQSLKVSNFTEVTYEKVMSLSMQPPNASTHDGACYGDLLSDTNSPAPDESFEESESVAIADRLLAQLEERERQVIICFFGLKGQTQLSLDDIAEKIGVSTERVRQIKRSVLAKFKTKAKNLI